MSRRVLRWCLALAGTTAAILAAAGVAHGQSWRPEKPVELLVGSGAGGSNDTMARHLQRIMQERKLVAAPVNVLNKTGGNQTVVRTYLNQHPGDAHYLDMASPTLNVNHITGLAAHQHYTEFSPVALMINEYTVFTVRADSPVRNARDLADVHRKNPDAWSAGVSNIGGTNHLTYTLLGRAAGVDARKLKIVVFKSNTEGMAAVMGGHLNMVAGAVASAMPHVRSGNARIIAIGGPRRMGGLLAEVPTLREQGFDIELSNWRGIVGPKGLGAAQVAFWEEVLAKVVAAEEWQKSLDAQYWDGNFLRSREFAQYLEKDYNQARTVMVELGLAR